MLIKKKKERKYHQHSQKHYTKNYVAVWVGGKHNKCISCWIHILSCNWAGDLYLFIWATAAAPARRLCHARYTAVSPLGAGMFAATSTTYKMSQKIKGRGPIKFARYQSYQPISEHNTYGQMFTLIIHGKMEFPRHPAPPWHVSPARQKNKKQLSPLGT